MRTTCLNNVSNNKFEILIRIGRKKWMQRTSFQSLQIKQEQENLLISLMQILKRLTPTFTYRLTDFIQVMSRPI